MRCYEYVYDALAAAMQDRDTTDDDWIDNERHAVAVAGNEWAGAHGIEQRITVADVERIETVALGHVDYATQLALRVERYITTGK